MLTFDIISTIITAAATGFFGWFFGRKKQRSEELTAATASWNELKQSMQDDIHDLLEQHEKDKAKIAELSAKVDELTNTIAELQREIRKWQKSND